MVCRHPVLLVLAGGLCFAGAAPAAETPPAGDDLVRLLPFTVNTDRDTGYQAVSSLAGGRIDTPLDRTPAALSVLTREFLDDIAADNFIQAALWSPNSSAVPDMPDSNEMRINFRSTAGGSNPTVNYFAFPIAMDAFSIERIEFARGPNSIVYGPGNLAGFATVDLKQPRFRDFEQVRLRFDNFHTARASLDVNRRLLGGKAALRFAALRQDGERWRQPNPDDRDGYFLAGLVQLDATTVARFEAEYGTQQRTWAEGIFFDNLSSWNGAPFNGDGSRPVPPSPGLQGFPPSADYLLFNPAHPERGVINLRGFARTTGAQNLAVVPDGRPYIPNFPTLPSRDFDLQPPNNLQFTRYYFATAYLEKQFGRDFFVQLAANQRQSDRRREGTNWTSALRRDPNAFLPGGAANPDFGQLYVDGEPTTQRQVDTLRDYRLLATYRLEVAGMEHRLSGFVSEQSLRSDATQDRFVRTGNAANPSPTSGANFIQQRFYLAAPAGLPFAYDPGAFGGLNVRKYRFNQVRNLTDGFTAQAAVVSRYFGGKLSSMVGYRFDDTDRATIDGDPDPVTGNLIFDRRDFGEAIGTTTAGAVWYPVPQLGPFLNYSESFSPAPVGDPLLNSRRQPDAARGNGVEAGVYFKLLGERVQGSLRYYASVQRGRVLNAPGVPSINAIWQALGQTANVEVGAVRDTQSLTSTGYEFELTANVTPAWRTLLNFAVPRSRQQDSFPETIAYRARFLGPWQAAAATNPTVANNLQSLDAAIVAGADGREQNGEVKYRANLYSTYDVRRGPLQGVSFGGGANLFGAQIAGNGQNRPFDYLYSPGYTIASAQLAYAGKWRETRYKVQLNVTNLFDRRVLVFTNAGHYNPPPGSGGSAGDYLASFRYVDPRRIALTTTVEF